MADRLEMAARGEVLTDRRARRYAGREADRRVEGAAHV